MARRDGIAAKLAQARRLAASGRYGTQKELAAAVGVSPATLRRHGIKVTQHPTPTGADMTTGLDAPGPATVRTLSDEILAEDAAGSFQRLNVSVDGLDVGLSAESGRWVYAGSAPVGANPVVYTHAVKEALAGAAMAKALNERVVSSRHATILAEHVSALMVGRCIAATADGAAPIAFQAAGMWVLNQIGADLMQSWENDRDPDEAQPRSYELLDDAYQFTDPLHGAAGDDAPLNIIYSEPVDIDELRADVASAPADLRDELQDLLDEVEAHLEADPDSQHPGLRVDPGGYVHSCVEQAYRQLAGGDHVMIDPFPLARLADEAMTNSPVVAADRTGVGTAVGGGLGACAAFYEAHTAAGTGACLNGLVVMSAAHRDDPGSDTFQRWLQQHLNPPPGSSFESASMIESRRSAIVGVLDVAAYAEPDADIAAGALETVAQHAPEQFTDAVCGFAARFGSETEMLACFNSWPRLAERARSALRRR